MLIKKAVEVTPDNESLQYNLGKIARQKGLLDVAVLAFQKTLELNSDNIPATMDLAGIYLKGARDIAAQADKVPPKDEKKFNELNEKSKTEYKKVLPLLEKVHQKNPSDNKTSVSLKEVYQKLGENDKLQKLQEELKAKQAEQKK